MAPDKWEDPKKKLPLLKHYTTRPVLKDDEELVCYRRPVACENGLYEIAMRPGEIIIGTDGARFPYGTAYAHEGRFCVGTKRYGRYVVRKKGEMKTEEIQLEKRVGYIETPTVKADEEYVDYRTKGADGFIRWGPDEFLVIDNNERYSYAGHDGRFCPSRGGRYIVRKKVSVGTPPEGTCEYCYKPYELGKLRKHFEQDCPTSHIYKGKITLTQEVTMAEQKPLNYKRETLIEALQEAVKKNEAKRAADKKEAQKKADEKVAQLVDLIKKNPRFASEMINRATSLMGSVHEVGTESFKESVEKNYPAQDEEEIEYDTELKKLIRVYEKAEDESVEVSVNDTAYNYL